MFVSILRKIYSALTALFWSNSRKWFAGIATSFWAIQHIACAYGPDDGREPLGTCTPIYDYDRLAEAPLSTENYSECEQTLTEALVYLGKCNKPCENSLVMPVASPLDSTKTTLATYCRDEGRPDCSANAQSAKSSVIRETEFECGCNTRFKNMIADSLITGFTCDGEKVSVEEGLHRGQLGANENL